MLCLFDNFVYLYISDPIFPLNFLLHSWVPLAVDAVFQVTFLAGMLLFWLCAFHGIRQVGFINGHHVCLLLLYHNVSACIFH